MWAKTVDPQCVPVSASANRLSLNILFYLIFNCVAPRRILTSLNMFTCASDTKKKCLQFAVYAVYPSIVVKWF